MNLLIVYYLLIVFPPKFCPFCIYDAEFNLQMQQNSD